MVTYSLEDFKEKIEFYQYLGDGVYVGFDGLHIVLVVSNGMEASPIYLEPQVLEEFDRYRERLNEAIKLKKGEE